MDFNAVASFGSVNYSVASMDVSNINSGLVTAMSGLDSMFSTMASQTTAGANQADMYNMSSLMSNNTMMAAYTNGTATNSYLDCCNLQMPSAESVISMFEGLNKDSTVEDYTTAWLKANNPGMTDEQIANINKMYGSNTQQMQDYYKGLEEKYAYLGETGEDGKEADIKQYYRAFLSEMHPEMSADEVEKLCVQYEAEAKQTEAQYKQIAEASGLNENSTLNDYYKYMARQMNPNASEEEITSIVAQMEKQSQPMLDYYDELARVAKEKGLLETEELGDYTVGPSSEFKHNHNYGVNALLNEANSMVGYSEHNKSDVAAINQITGESGIDCSQTPWCAAWAMNMLQDHGLLDVSGCSNRNYCPTVKNWAIDQGIYREAKSGYVPRPGDAILYDWQSDDIHRAQHIGIVEKVEDGKVYTIEGNIGDKVDKRCYSLSYGSIIGYIDVGAQK